MRKFSFVLGIALVVLVASPAWAHTVTCDGLESGGSGGNTCGANLLYTYSVTDTTGTVTDLYIGTHDANIGSYTSICMPAGWAMVIEPNVIKIEHGVDKTAHGEVSAVSTQGTAFCPTVIHFSGPAGIPGGNFTFGFDNAQPSHDVDWQVTDAGGNQRADWAENVGDGVGPVHGPSLDIPAVSEWGLLAMALLVLVAGTIVVRRTRPVVA